jgi:Cof subfamily protein (haloacid dehalogenase superfamily)
MGVRLIALDIDGTIIPPAHYGHDHAPSERLIRVIREVSDQGIAVVLASGRMFPGTASVAKALGLVTPVICQQGCSIHTLDGEMLHQFPIRHETALDIVGYAREIRRAYEWFNPLRYIVSEESPATVQYGVVSGIRPEYRRDPENAGVIPTGVGIISSEEEANGIHRALVARHGDDVHFLDFPSVTVAVAPDANKGHALSLLCDDLGIDRHETLAIGDSVNDASMLAWAGHGIALAHSDAYARDAADEILAEESADPVADLLEARILRR